MYVTLSCLVSSYPTTLFVLSYHAMFCHILSSLDFFIVSGCVMYCPWGPVLSSLVFFCAWFCHVLLLFSILFFWLGLFCIVLFFLFCLILSCLFLFCNIASSVFLCHILFCSALTWLLRFMSCRAVICPILSCFVQSYIILCSVLSWHTCSVLAVLFYLTALYPDFKCKVSSLYNFLSCMSCSVWLRYVQTSSVRSLLYIMRTLHAIGFLKA